MQRLYSMFPAGAPGVALLVLRSCIAVALAGIVFPSGWQRAVFFVLLGMLCIGLLTPMACASLTMAVLLDLPRLQAGKPVELAIILLSASSYAFLGPGAYSVDARLFARRKLVSTDSSGLGREH